MGKHPVAAPQLAHKGVAVLESDRADGCLAYMGNHVMALDGVAAQHLCNGGGGGALFVNKVAHPAPGIIAIALEERDAPTVGVVVSAAAALRKAGEAQRQAGRQVAVHPQQLAHGARLQAQL